MQGYDEDFYENTAPFDAEVEALKDHLREGVAKEIKDRVELLTTQNEELTRRLQNLGQLERAAQDTQRRYEQKLHNAEVVARRTVEKEALGKLLELLREPRYRVNRSWDLGPKCDRCDEERRLAYTTPLGRESYESCECATRSALWEVEETLVHEVARRSGKLLAWYKGTGRSLAEDYVSSPTVLQSPDGVALEEMAKNPMNYGFPTEAAAQLLADALNGADA